MIRDIGCSSVSCLADFRKHRGTFTKYPEDEKFILTGIINLPGVELPKALEKKYPDAGKEWAWFRIFPSPRISVDPGSGIAGRHYLFPSLLQKSFKPVF